MQTIPAFTTDRATAFAEIALANVVREFPNKLDHVMAGAGDARRPRELHPAFYGSFDWHSCVHMHWLLARVRRIFPDLPQAAAIAAVFDNHLTDANVAAECAYLARPEARGFERTYGWAWLLAWRRSWRAERMPHRVAGRGSCYRLQTPSCIAISITFPASISRCVRGCMRTARSDSCSRSTTREPWATRGSGGAVCRARPKLVRGDRDAPARWEPSGTDFLSPVLMEALLMRQVLQGREFTAWLDAFLPGLALREPASLFTPAAVSDRTDPFIVHLDGLNLSRAWCFTGIAQSLPDSDPRAAILRDAGERASRRWPCRACGRRLHGRALARDLCHSRVVPVDWTVHD